jgi:hypothetical protein
MSAMPIRHQRIAAPALQLSRPLCSTYVPGTYLLPRDCRCISRGAGRDGDDDDAIHAMGSRRCCSSSIACRSSLCRRSLFRWQHVQLSQPLASPMLQDQHERSIAQQRQRRIRTIKISIAARMRKSARADRRNYWRYISTQYIGIIQEP